MKLYFGDGVTIVTTVSLLAMITFVVYSAVRHAEINYWGRRTLILIAFGLYVCCKAATRDGFHLTVQNAIDGSCAPGLFGLLSVPAIAGYIGAAIILISGIATIFCRSQNAREVLFFTMSGGIGLKIATIELARIFC